MSVQAPGRSWIGRALPRREDVRFLTGASRFIGDVRLESMLHAAFVRSPYAHAHMTTVRTEAASRATDVRAVLTAADLLGRVGTFPLNPVEDGELCQVPHPLLGADRVRYVGEPIAVVVAETPEAAVDAAELIEADFEELPPVVDAEAALASDTLLHDGTPENVLLRWRHAEGPVDEVFADAARVVRQRIQIPRLVASPLEPRGAVACYDAAEDLLTLWISAQDPYRQLSGLSPVLRRPPERLRIIVPDVGGAFGSKGVPAPETAVVAICAVDLGRPVAWIETRTENTLAAYQGRGLQVEAELALAADAKVLGLRASMIADLGAYLYPTTAVAPITAAKLMTGCYVIRAAEVELLGVATNKVPTGPYRGAGRPEAAFVIERLIDLAAAELGLEPATMRRRNFIPPEAFPYRTALGFTYDSGNYPAALDRALRRVDYAALRAEQERARAEGRLFGIGIGMYVERCGPGWETASVRVEPAGRVVCRTGSTPHGQGHETTFAQIAADELGVEPDEVDVRWGDTAELPNGTGTFASRSVAVGGSALLLALRDVRAQLESAREREGREDLGLFEAAPLVAEARFELAGPVFSSGAYVAAIEVLADTGEVTVLRLVAVDDAGRIINPLLAEGQVVGAAAQGFGECFLEQTGWDEQGQPLALNLYEYHLPTAMSVPRVESELAETPSPLNPLGAKGVGEGGSIGTPAALANAVADALRPLGIRHLDPPFTPARVWAALAQCNGPLAAAR